MIIFFERKLLFTIINQTPEIADCKEIKVAKPICKHGLRCFEVECDLQHSLNPDGRRILRKKFDRKLKTIQMREQIRVEIETYRNGGWNDWILVIRRVSCEKMAKLIFCHLI